VATHGNTRDSQQLGTGDFALEPGSKSVAAPRSLVLLNTGDGKGKSTAALGVVMRAVAQGWPVCVIQFLKSGSWNAGEEFICRRLGVDWLNGGDGFVRKPAGRERSRACALDAWAQAGVALSSGEYRLVVLDELTYPVSFGWVQAEEVAETIAARHPQVNVVITGRRAPQALVDVADTVTDMVNVRHPFEQGILAQAGIDF